jgi:hypothetical protein
VSPHVRSWPVRKCCWRWNADRCARPCAALSRAPSERCRACSRCEAQWGRTGPRPSSPSDPLSTLWLSVQSAGPRPILCPMARTSSAGAIDAERRSGKPPLEGLVAATAIRLVGSVSDDRLDAAEARMCRQRGTLDPGSEGGSHRPARSDGSLLPPGGASTRERQVRRAATGPCVPVGGVLF